eukprot:jgi/Picsp_1/354/NSC_00353-R1_single-stranded nucleic acid binding r3h
MHGAHGLALSRHLLAGSEQQIRYLKGCKCASRTRWKLTTDLIQRIVVCEALENTLSERGRAEEVAKLQELEQAQELKRLDPSSMVELVMDYGRAPLVRVHLSNSKDLNDMSGVGKGNDVVLSREPVSKAEIQHVVDALGDFGQDNRAGIDGTLHRISAIRNRLGVPVGITCRVGEAVKGSAELLRDIVTEGKSVLLLGRPGIGKTTVIREISRILADDSLRRVMIVDTSNEIGGDGDVPHPGVGRARRLQVSEPAKQHKVMIEAVENHMPDVVVIDEIGTEDESLAARSISQRGVQLIATAHGNSIANIIKNPSLSDLVGGISSVTLGDVESKRRGVQKSVLERTAPPTFDVVVEMVSRVECIVHIDVANAVDGILRGEDATPQMRTLGKDGHVSISLHRPGHNTQDNQETRIFPSPLAYRENESHGAVEPVSSTQSTPLGMKKQSMTLSYVSESGEETKRDVSSLELCIEGIEDQILQEIDQQMKESKIHICKNIEQAHAVLTTRDALKSNDWIKEVAKYSRIPLFIVKGNTKSSILKGIGKIVANGMLPSRLQRHNGREPSQKGKSAASIRATGGILECKSAVDDIVLRKLQPLEIVPKDAETMDRLIAMVEEHNLQYSMVGKKDNGTLRVRILPLGYEEPVPEKQILEKAGKRVDLW